MLELRPGAGGWLVKNFGKDLHGVGERENREAAGSLLPVAEMGVRLWILRNRRSVDVSLCTSLS